MSNISNFGELIRAFNPDELIQRYYNQPLGAELGKAVGNVSNVYAQNQTDVNRFASAADSAYADLKKLNAEDQETMRGLIGRGVAYDPMNDRQSILNMDLGALKGLGEMLGNVGRRQQSLSLAGLGYGGGRGSGYQDSLNQSRVNTSIAPIAQSIFSNLGSNTASVGGLRNNNLMSVLNTINQRASVPYRGLDLRAAPIDMRNSTLGSYLSGLGSVGESSRLNTAGWETKTDPWADAFSAMDKSVNSAIDTYLAMYGGGMMGGAGGGMGGMSGLGGGGGAKGAAASVPTNKFNMYGSSGPYMSSGAMSPYQAAPIQSAYIPDGSGRPSNNTFSQPYWSMFN